MAARLMELVLPAPVRRHAGLALGQGGGYDLRFSCHYSRLIVSPLCSKPLTFLLSRASLVADLHYFEHIALQGLVASSEYLGVPVHLRDVRHYE